MSEEPAYLGTGLDYAVIVVYFVVIVGFGLWFARYTRTTTDFFFGGQRFAWWLIAFSCIATTVGSYSFVKYSEAGFRYGISSTQTYLNDWFWMPILLCVWLPIIYYGRIQSVPEYFERRFGRANRLAATALILIYLIGYVGINLLTIGQALSTLLGWPILAGAILTAFVVMLYMFAGGQTSVIMTDLAQGVILLVAGIGVFLAGVFYLGGFDVFWSALPKGHRYAFSEFNAPDQFSFIGIFAQDGLANSGAFVLMNQGIIMRFLSMRSVNDARRMTLFWVLILFPLAAIAVSGGGWVARALHEAGVIETTAQDAFIHASAFLCSPGIFGFVLAALIAALMSTADTLVTASSAVFLNDVYRPYVRPNMPDRHYLRVARVTSTVTVLIGIGLVLVFMQEESIYQAHAMFTAAVTPPIVIAILLGILWKRFTPAASFATMALGLGVVFLTFFKPWDDLLLKPMAFGMGPPSYNFIRALFGLVVCTVIGVAVALVTRPRTLDQIRGLVTGTQLDAMRQYKGGEPNRKPGALAHLRLEVDPDLEVGAAVVGPDALEVMNAGIGDVVYVCDTRWWFGGLRSVHLKLSETGAPGTVRIGTEARASAHLVDGQAVYVEKLL